MKTTIITLIVSLFFLSSCTQEEEFEVKSPDIVYSEETQQCIENVYTFCLEIYGEEIPQSLIYIPANTTQKIEVIKYCDLLDKSGDVFPGWDDYDNIKNILWPDGYPII